MILVFIQTGRGSNKNGSVAVNSNSVQYQVGVIQRFTNVYQQVKTIINSIVVKYLSVVREGQK